MGWRRWIAVAVSVLLSVGLFGVMVQAETGSPKGTATGMYRFTVIVEGARQGKIEVNRNDPFIEVESFSHGVTSTREAGSGMATGKRQHQPLVIRKRIDKATPKLYQALVTNENLRMVELAVSNPENRSVIYKISLENASIAEIVQGVNDEGIPYEEVSFTYHHIEWLWTDGGVMAEDDWTVRR